MKDNINCDRRILVEQEVNALWPTIKHIPLMQDLWAMNIPAIITNLRFFELKRGRFVFQSGDPATSMYIICRGHMKIFYNTIDGKEQIYYLYQEGDFVGGHNILEGTSYLYTGETLDDCLVAEISKDIFDRYLSHNIAIMRRILHKSFERIRWAEDLIQRLATKNTAMKVADLLLRLKENYGYRTPEGIRIELNINREEMGNFSGITRETITRKLGEFKDLGYIDYIGNKVILIKDLEALRNYCF
ncbi:MAG TPA: Crp/Fnr family transcriptional regulator [Clostridiaceae bacterium]|nr:Crp/Fnr family transcriptional regulator [Clostridiaceae bacterium]